MVFEQHDGEYDFIFVWTIPLVFEAYVQSIAHLWIVILHLSTYSSNSTTSIWADVFINRTCHPRQTSPTMFCFVAICPLGSHTTTIHFMTRRPSMSKSAIAQSKQVSRPLGTMLYVNLPTRPLSSLVIVPLATWHLVSQIQPLWAMNINDRLHSNLAPHPVLMFHICFSRKERKKKKKYTSLCSRRKISMLSSALWGKMSVS